MSKRVPVRVLETALNTYWAMTPDALEMVMAIAQRANPDPQAVAAELGRELDNTRTVTVRDGVAIIPVTGPLFRYANLFTEVSGATSLEVLAQDFTTAVDNPDVKAIVLAIDSPGGEVNGTEEMAELIYQARGTKPIVAHVSWMAGSGAYWLASAADEIVAAETTLIGSLGVAIAVVDTSRRDDAAGIDVIEIVSSQSPLKREDPFTNEGRKRLQATTDQLAQVFMNAVARNRNVTLATVADEYGKGAMLIGRLAVKAGLADRISTFEALHAALVAKTADQQLNLEPAAVTRPLQVAAAMPPVGNMLATACYQSGLIPRFSLSTEPPVLPALAPPRVAPSTEPAPSQAVHREDRMDKITPAAPDTGVEDAVAAAKKELAERNATIKALCEEHDLREHAADYIVSELSLTEIQQDMLKQVRAKSAKPLEVPASDRIRVGQDRAAAEPYANAGQQLMDIRQAMLSPTQTNPRLEQVHRDFVAATGLSEAVDSDGGFLLQPTLSDKFFEKTFNEGFILSRVSRTPIGANSNALTINGIDETSRADGSRYGGVRGYWLNEAEAITASKPKFSKIDLKLQGVAAAVYATDEELQDVVALDSRINRVVPKELTFKIEDAIVNGDGSGKPLGYLQSNALISVAKETGQLANTIQVENIVNMWSRAWGAGRTGGIWLYNQDIEPQLLTMGITFGTGGQAVYMPSNGISEAPFGTLLGRPMFPIEYAATLGTVGDISFVEFDQYEVIDKGGVMAARSIHVRFLEQEQIFRFTMRIDGQPAWKSALTPKNGTNTQSPFVALATRA